MAYLSRLCALLAGVLLISVASPAATQAQNEPFITIWDTENPGESNDDQIIIPGEGTDYTVNWEEVGNTSNNGSLTVASGDTTITFPNPGLYRLKISGGFTRIHFGGGSGGDDSKIELVKQWGDIKWSTMEQAFSGASNLDLDADDTPVLANVSDMSRMFAGAESMSADGSTIGKWDVSSVNDMSRMFQDAGAFNQDIGNWNTSNVTNMRRMFHKATSFNKDIGDWNVSSVNNMSGMFQDATKFNKDIGGWDTRNVTDMSAMFRGFNSDTSFNRDIGGWNTSKVTTMAVMFQNASSFNQDISGWDTGNVTEMRKMFTGAESFNQNLGQWDVSAVESGTVSGMFNMFRRTALSTTNYDRTLIGWAVQDLQGGVTLGEFNVEYCNIGPFRSHLINEFGWTIDDGGQQQGCPKILTASSHSQVDDDGTFTFTDIPAELMFSGLIGSGRVTVARYSDAPRNVRGISESDVSEYRLVVAGSGLTFFDSTKVRLPISDYGGISQPEDVIVYRRLRPGTGTFKALETTVDDNGTEKISDDTLSAKVTEDFGEFVLASNTNELPVELATFSAAATEGSARLTWQTASETNNAGFEVQRQKDEGWTQVGYVESKAAGGTTTETHSYSYVAEDLPVGTHQFRLKQIDLDGSSTLHGPISVEIKMQKAVKLVAPSPNPVSTNATLSFAIKEKTETTIALYNTLGQQVATLYEGTPTAGDQQTTQIDASGLPSGTYFIRLRAGENTETRRMMVVR